MKHAVESVVGASQDRAVLDGIRWCHEHGATVRWCAGPAEVIDAACVVEVLAPGTNWNLLRGSGPGFFEAYSDARGKHEAWARDVLVRPPHAPKHDGRRWSA